MTEPAIGEQCDPNTGVLSPFDPNATPSSLALASTPTCTLGCTFSICGDEFINTSDPNGEKCDDGGTCNGGFGDGLGCNLVICGGCTASIFSGLCPACPCSDGNTSTDADACAVADGDGCDTDCQIEACGNGVTDVGIGEFCDPNTGVLLAFDDDPNSINALLPAGSAAIESSASCTSVCTPSFCGDSLINEVADEECDDVTICLGATNFKSPCPKAACDGCVAAGPGFPVSPPSFCSSCNCSAGDTTTDAGTCTNPAPSGACAADCTLIQCGDGDPNQGAESCDPGTGAAFDPNGNAFCVGGFAPGDACSSPGTIAAECLGGLCVGDPLSALGGSSTCNLDCTTSECGDDIANAAAGEQCDDGNAQAKDGCCEVGGPSLVPDGNCPRGQCVVEFCGDGILQSTSNDPNFEAEACDPCTTTDPNDLNGACPGANTASADCNDDCTTAECGDAKTNTAAGEQCDDGLQCTGGPSAGLDCTLVDFCGAGTCEKQNGDGCGLTCQLEACQDGVEDFGEDCDPNVNFGETATCNSDCTDQACPDGKLNQSAGEECDDGNTADGDGCDGSCRDELCGNGVLGASGNSEECDDGNQINDDGCTVDCKVDPDTDGELNATPDDACASFLIDPNTGLPCSPLFEGCGIPTWTSPATSPPDTNPSKARLDMKNIGGGKADITLRGRFNPRFGKVCSEAQEIGCTSLADCLGETGDCPVATCENAGAVGRSCTTAADCGLGVCGLPDPSLTGVHIEIKNGSAVIYDVTVVGDDPDGVIGVEGQYAKNKRRCPQSAASKDGWTKKTGAKTKYKYTNKSTVMPAIGESPPTCTGNPNGLKQVKIDIDGSKGFYKYKVRIKGATLVNTPALQGGQVLGTLQSQVSLGHSNGAINGTSDEGKAGQCADAQFKRDPGTGLVPTSTCKVSRGGARVKCKNRP